MNFAANLPSNVRFISATSSQWLAPIDQAGVVSANLGELDPGHSATVSLVLEPTTTTGTIVLPASVNSDEYDPDDSNNQAATTVPIAPAVNLALSMTPTSPTVLSGHELSFSMNVTNTGPSTATNVVLNFPIGTGWTLSGSSTTQGASVFNPGQLTATLGSLNTGSTATVTVSLVPSTPGPMTQSATVTSDEYQINPETATASVAVTVQPSAGVLQFGSAAYADAETAGIAVLTVDRIDGALGPASVSYQTVAVNATPGLDYTPTSGILVFAPGQTSAVIQVPVLADPWDNHDEYLNVVLQDPGGGATLGSISTASLRIIDVDPDYTAPQVSQLSWTGNQQAITSVTLAFTAPLNPMFALDPSDFVLTDLDDGDRSIPMSAPVYNAANFTVTLSPSVPLADNQFYQVEIIGTGPTAIRDLAGNLLDGSGSGTSGTNYIASFAQGTKLQYVDNVGNKVSLRLTGPGYLEQIRDASGEGESLAIMGHVSNRTTLSGTVRKSKGKSGQTNLGVIQGLGNFGTVRVKLPSPPFYVRQFPFIKRGRGVL